mmetsp:Transcript_24429/g.51846  ORF Transcript_24429/g.51846 Transcript_24429/m.51846 type:complete len:308 (-) Transcript_24429:313-1236(-)
MAGGIGIARFGVTRPRIAWSRIARRRVVARTWITRLRPTRSGIARRRVVARTGITRLRPTAARLLVRPPARPRVRLVLGTTAASVLSMLQLQFQRRREHAPSILATRQYARSVVVRGRYSKGHVRSMPHAHAIPDGIGGIDIEPRVPPRIGIAERTRMGALRRHLVRGGVPRDAILAPIVLFGHDLDFHPAATLFERHDLQHRLGDVVLVQVVEVGDVEPEEGVDPSVVVLEGVLVEVRVGIAQVDEDVVRGVKDDVAVVVVVGGGVTVMIAPLVVSPGRGSSCVLLVPLCVLVSIFASIILVSIPA